MAFHVFPQSVLAIILLIEDLIHIVISRAYTGCWVGLALLLSQPCQGQGLLPSLLEYKLWGSDLIRRLTFSVHTVYQRWWLVRQVIICVIIESIHATFASFHGSAQNQPKVTSFFPLCSSYTVVWSWLVYRGEALYLQDWGVVLLSGAWGACSRSVPEHRSAPGCSLQETNCCVLLPRVCLPETWVSVVPPAWTHSSELGWPLYVIFEN